MLKKKKIEIEIIERPNVRAVKEEKEKKVMSFVDRVRARQLNHSGIEWKQK
jgi:hypothetical protein